MPTAVPPTAIPEPAGHHHRRRFTAVWRWARFVLGIVLAGFAIWAVSGKTEELSGASSFLTHIHWQWVFLAVIAEGVSYVSFANMQRRLMLSGDVGVPLTGMTGITLAGNAIQTTLPAGIVLSAAFSFRQYRRYGADDVLAGWVLIAMTVVSFGTLAAVAAVGLGLAFGTGSAFNLVSVIIGIVTTAIVLVLIWLKRPVWLPWLGTLIRLSQRVSHYPKGDADVLLQEWLTRVSAISPSKSAWANAAVWGLGNWAADLSCLVFSFLAVGAGVPWRGLLLAYGAAQLATNLPVTPGGLGVVEGSLTVALVAFGGAEASTVAAVLLYRLFSFWLMLPVGWSSWAAITLVNRRRDRADFVAEVSSA